MFAQVIDTYDTCNNKAVGLVYLDFQKAFNKVPQERLRVKINAHGIQGDAARWIRNWLAGKPHGSVLGPLLFLMYINDLDSNIVSKISKFADDTKLSRRARNPDDIMELQAISINLLSWKTSGK